MIPFTGNKVRLYRLLEAAALIIFAATAISGRAALCQLQVGYDTSYTACVNYGADAGMSEIVYDSALDASFRGGDPLPPGTLGSSFYTVCMDISQNLISSGYWKSEAFPFGNNGNTIQWTAGGVFRAASLYNTYVGQVNFNSSGGKEVGAALQLAVWDVLYGSAVSGNTWDVTEKTYSGNGSDAFYVSGANADIVALANAMLNGTYNKTDANLQYTFWNATDSSGASIGNQDLISPPPPTGYVPEPGTGMAAAFAALCALIFVLRRNVRPV